VFELIVERDNERDSLGERDNERESLGEPDDDMVGVIVGDLLTETLIVELTVLVVSTDAVPESDSVCVVVAESKTVCVVVAKPVSVEKKDSDTVPNNFTTALALSGTIHTLLPSNTPPANAYAPLVSPPGQPLYSVIVPIEVLTFTTALALRGTIHTLLPSNTPPANAPDPLVSTGGRLSTGDSQRATLNGRATLNERL